MSEQEVAFYLRQPSTIRYSCEQVLAFARADKLKAWQLNESAWNPLLDFVHQCITKNYPKGNIPWHSRIRHIDCDGTNRWQELSKKLNDSRASLFEYVMVSVLVDAGAGSKWKYRLNGKAFSRSEGLAIACHQLFCQGFFSNAAAKDPYRVDGGKLQSLTMQDLEQGFSVSEQNPLLGITGRLELLQRLGELIGKGRLADCLEPLLGSAFAITAGEIDIAKMFPKLLETFSSIWPEGYILEGQNLGDIAPYPGIKAKIKGAEGIVAFHKLSQWLCYSLADAANTLGHRVVNIDCLTGLPEYRNGGLFLDLGLIRAKHSVDVTKEYSPQSIEIIEWRALTVALLDELLLQWNKRYPQQRLNLAQLLQGGTWSAGREIARKLRKEGGSPLLVASKGSLF